MMIITRVKGLTRLEMFATPYSTIPLSIGNPDRPVSHKVASRIPKRWVVA